MKILNHDSTTITQHREKRTVLKHDEQGKGKGENSPLSYGVESRKRVRKEENTIDGCTKSSRKIRQEEEAIVPVTDYEGPLTDLGKGRSPLGWSRLRTPKDLPSRSPHLACHIEGWSSSFKVEIPNKNMRM